MFLFFSLSLPTTKSAGCPHSVPSPSPASCEAQAWFDWFVGSEMKSLEKEQEKVKRYLSSGAIRVLKSCLVLTSGWEKNGRQRKNRKNYYCASLCGWESPQGNWNHSETVFVSLTVIFLWDWTTLPLQYGYIFYCWLKSLQSWSLHCSWHQTRPHWQQGPLGCSLWFSPGAQSEQEVSSGSLLLSLCWGTWVPPWLLPIASNPSKLADSPQSNQ